MKLVTVFVSILLLVAILVVIAAIAHILWRIVRLARPRNLHPTHGRHRASDAAYGPVPTLDGPVGPIDKPGPDADLSSNAASPHDVYR